RHQFDAELRHKITRQRHWRVTYQLELNEREDLATLTTFTSYSPTRHNLRLAGEIPLASEWTLGGDLRYRLSDYNEDNLYSDGSSERREDVQLQARLKLRYALSTNWEAQLEYSYTNNDSSIDGFDYDRNLYLLGISTLF
ncbi:MAG: outer membrane beta-barrel protein, partial [Pseudomonadota bacterium]